MSKRDTMDYLKPYEWITISVKAENKTIHQRVSVDTHKTMNFTLSNNMSNSEYDMNYTVTMP
jgi:hypothetical protein